MSKRMFIAVTVDDDELDTSDVSLMVECGTKRTFKDATAWESLADLQRDIQEGYVLPDGHDSPKAKGEPKAKGDPGDWELRRAEDGHCE